MGKNEVRHTIWIGKRLDRALRIVAAERHMPIVNVIRMALVRYPPIQAQFDRASIRKAVEKAGLLDGIKE